MRDDDIYRSSVVVKEQVCQRRFPSGKFVADNIFLMYGGEEKCCGVFLLCAGDALLRRKWLTSVWLRRKPGGFSHRAQRRRSFSTSTNPSCPDIVLPQTRGHAFKPETFIFICIAFMSESSCPETK